MALEQVLLLEPARHLTSGLEVALVTHGLEVVKSIQHITQQEAAVTLVCQQHLYLLDIKDHRGYSWPVMVLGRESSTPIRGRVCYLNPHQPLPALAQEMRKQFLSLVSS